MVTPRAKTISSRYFARPHFLTTGVPDFRQVRTPVKPSARAWDGCRICQLRGPRCIDQATTVDHIIPASLGGTDHEDNLGAACQPCHNQKTALEAANARALRRRRRSRCVCGAFAIRARRSHLAGARTGNSPGLWETVTWTPACRAARRRPHADAGVRRPGRPSRSRSARPVAS